MKRLVKVGMCLLLMLGLSGIQGVSAEGISTYTGDAEEDTSAKRDEILSKFDENSITVNNTYLEVLESSKDESPQFNETYNAYKDYDVLYQQGTSVNTLEFFGFDVMVDGEEIMVHGIEGKMDVKDGFILKSEVKKNPANNKNFLETAQDFIITVEITLTSKDGKSKTVEKELNAKVVEVVGKFVNRKADLILEKCLQYDDFNESKIDVIKNFVKDSVTSLKVQLTDGTFIDVDGYFMESYGFGGGDGRFIESAAGTYDFKYLLEGADRLWVSTRLTGYLIDIDGNMVDYEGKVLVPFDKRESKYFGSTNADIKLNAKIGTLPEGATLDSKVRSDLNLDKEYIAYDMNVIYNGEYIQPVGSVDLSITVPESLLNKKLSVYYLDEQGNLNELSSSVNGNIISFATTHFSTYVIMENEGSSAPTIENNKNENLSTSTDAIKNTSKDGLNNTQGIAISLLSLLVVGIVVTMKRKNS